MSMKAYSAITVGILFDNYDDAEDFLESLPKNKLDIDRHYLHDTEQIVGVQVFVAEEDDYVQELNSFDAEIQKTKEQLALVFGDRMAECRTFFYTSYR